MHYYILYIKYMKNHITYIICIWVSIYLLGHVQTLFGRECKKQAILGASGEVNCGGDRQAWGRKEGRVAPGTVLHLVNMESCDCRSH